jgi:hypothetical protein
MGVARKPALTTQNQLLGKNIDFEQFKRGFYNRPGAAFRRDLDAAVQRW